MWTAAPEQVDPAAGLAGCWVGQGYRAPAPSHLSTPSFNLKDVAPGLGSETRLDRSKGDARSDTALLDSSATLLTNEGRQPGGARVLPAGLRATPTSSHPSSADNEETEGSDVPADYLLGDAEGEEEELYLLDPEHAHREPAGLQLGVGQG